MPVATSFYEIRSAAQPYRSLYNLYCRSRTGPSTKSVWLQPYRSLYKMLREHLRYLHSVKCFFMFHTPTC